MTSIFQDFGRTWSLRHGSAGPGGCATDWVGGVVGKQTQNEHRQTLFLKLPIGKIVTIWAGG